MGTAVATPDPNAINAAMRAAVLARASEYTQLISSQQISPASNPQLTIPLNNVGLVKRLVVEVIGTLNNTDAAVAATLTDWGLANLISNATFTDLGNNIRIQTDGKHLSMLANAKRGYPAYASADYNRTNGSNLSQTLNVNPAAWGVHKAPATIAASGSATVRTVFEIPLAFSDDDLRGAIYANVINATMKLALTFNQSAFASGAVSDNVDAVYSGSSGGTFTGATVNVYQVYLGNLPVMQNGQEIVPLIDTATVYELKQTNFVTFSQGQDTPLPYANFRSFFSTMLIYNNAGNAAGRQYGTDINYMAISMANFVNLWKKSPLLLAAQQRDLLMEDTPAGTYYLSHRKSPINTSQYGNTQLLINPSVANAGAYARAYYEAMAITNTLTGSSSLASQG